MAQMICCAWDFFICWKEVGVVGDDNRLMVRLLTRNISGSNFIVSNLSKFYPLFYRTVTYSDFIQSDGSTLLLLPCGRH
ncbi:hypothetical protein LWI28_020380 [Acer negundo]|uniref:Uncharacterized protein n=1 Tax=Acer negundo TaxID=4023 RepID=A0AAD5JAW5_ACENE|nr:hypothetical protein LWI28_020380 [Acer negundo]